MVGRAVQEVAAQQKEENERLRGNLEEWSRRNAKLELRLNALSQQLLGLSSPGAAPPSFSCAPGP